MIIVPSKPREQLTEAERRYIVELSQTMKSCRRLCSVLGTTIRTLEGMMARRRSVRASTIRRVRANLLRHLNLNGRVTHVHGTVQ